MIGEDDADLAPVIGVDGAGAVQHRDRVLRRQARAGPNLGLETVGQGDGDAGRDDAVLARAYDDVLIEGGGEVQPRALRRRVGRKRQALAVRQLADRDRNLTHGGLAR